MISEAGLVSEISRTDENNPLVRTALDPQLMLIAREWTRGAVKTVPPRMAARGRVSCGPGRWRRAPPRPTTATCWDWTRMLPTPTRALAVGHDAGGDRPDLDRDQRLTSSPADQWAASAYRAWWRT